MAGGRRSHGQGTFWGDLIGPNPTDRGKAGTKRSLLVDGEGGPLSIVVAGANVHDAKLLEATLDAIVVERPQPTEEEPQHLCLDKGYDNPSGRGAAAGHGYREHIRRIGEEKLDASGDKRYPARRWVVERTLAWLSKCRAVLVRYDKKAANYLECVTARMCAPVVPATVASGHFEIVTKECRLLEYLMRHPNQVLTRTMIAEHVWNYEFDNATNVIDVHIRNLRRKIDDSFPAKLIQTIRGAGYRASSRQPE